MRPAEVNQHAVAQELGDRSVINGDLTGDRIVVAPHNIAQLLGVERRGELRRADQVTEHDRQLPTLDCPLLAEIAGRRFIPLRSASC